jgi:VanZ family protein
MYLKIVILSLAILLANSQALSGVNIALLPAAFNSMIQSYLPVWMCKSTDLVIPDFTFMGYTFSGAKFVSMNLD